jgi:hypothetical protein
MCCAIDLQVCADLVLPRKHNGKIVTHNPMTEGSNPATGTGTKEITKKFMIKYNSPLKV